MYSAWVRRLAAVALACLLAACRAAGAETGGALRAAIQEQMGGQISAEAMGGGALEAFKRPGWPFKGLFLLGDGMCHPATDGYNSFPYDWFCGGKACTLEQCFRFINMTWIPHTALSYNMADKTCVGVFKAKPKVRLVSHEPRNKRCFAVDFLKYSDWGYNFAPTMFDFTIVGRGTCLSTDGIQGSTTTACSAEYPCLLQECMSRCKAADYCRAFTFRELTTTGFTGTCVIHHKEMTTVATAQGTRCFAAEVDPAIVEPYVKLVGAGSCSGGGQPTLQCDAGAPCSKADCLSRCVMDRTCKGVEYIPLNSASDEKAGTCRLFTAEPFGSNGNSNSVCYKRSFGWPV